MVKKFVLMRVSPELAKVINFIRAKNMLEGRKAGSVVDITEKIAKKTDKEELWRDHFIKF